MNNPMVCVALCKCGKTRMMSVLNDDGSYSDVCKEELKLLKNTDFEIKHVPIDDARKLDLCFHQYGKCNE